MRRLTFAESGLTSEEYKTLVRLTTPIKIQDYLDAIPLIMKRKATPTCRRAV